MMEGGEVILDIGRQEKEKLTLDTLIQKFRQIKKRDLNSDRILLS